MILNDTIAAISSAIGAGGRIIVRISGSQSLPLAQLLGAKYEQEGGTAERREISVKAMRVPAWIYAFHAPRSYTGEDSVEFHIPGNELLAKLLLDELLKNGARMAEPGEFTARAYFNGRMDLAKAEGVALAVAAVNEQELAAARRLLGGELARRLTPAMDLLVDTLALVEVGIDFSQEDVSFLSGSEVRDRIGRVDSELARLLTESTRFERLTHEPRVVLVGRANAGKSTLLNALAGHERAVVSAVAGTTRDVLWAEVALTRGIVRVTDVAGIEEGASASEIERKMREQALRAVQTGDVLVLVREFNDPRPVLTLPREADWVVHTKLDLAAPHVAKVQGVAVSALTGEGMDELKSGLDSICFGGVSAGLSLALNVRHVRNINDARETLTRAAGGAGVEAAEVIALELREALDCLGSILGQVTPDDVLGRIFSGFCIGK